jgi:HlyD family secretion protein
MLKLISILFGIAAIIGLGIVIDRDSRPKETASRPMPDLRSAPIYASGRVEGVTEEIELRPELHARVVEIPVHEGQRIGAGELLIRLDSAEQEYRRAEASAAVAAAEAELERLTNGARDEERREAAANVAALTAQLAGVRQRYERLSSLRQSGAAAAQEVDDLDTDINRLTAQLDAARARQELLEAPAREDELRRARAKVAAAQAQLKLAEYECSKTALIAPLRVQVLKLNANVGELAGPGVREASVIVADTSKLFIRAYVDELDAPRIRLDMPARVTTDGLPGKQVHGRVVRMSPRMSRKPLRTDAATERFDTKVREIWIELEGIDMAGLIVGLPVDVVVEVTEAMEH